MEEPIHDEPVGACLHDGEVDTREQRMLHQIVPVVVRLPIDVEVELSDVVGPRKSAVGILVVDRRVQERNLDIAGTTLLRSHVERPDSLRTGISLRDP